MTTEETKQAAFAISTRMADMTNSEREVVLEAMRQLFCTRCGDDGPEDDCVCQLNFYPLD